MDTTAVTIAIIGSIGGILASIPGIIAAMKSSKTEKAIKAPSEHATRHSAAIQDISNMLGKHMEDDAEWRKRIEDKVDAHALYSLIETDCHEFLKRRGEKRFLSRQEARAFSEYLRQYKELSGNDLNGLEQAVSQVHAMPVRG